MFVIILSYKKPLIEVDKFAQAHIAFLDKYYAKEKFIASGRQNPRTGGIIIAYNLTRKELEELLKEDPFHQNGVAKYNIIEFIPVKYQEAFKSFIKE